MKRKIVPMMIVGAMLTSAVPAQAATLPMFKQSETVTISREEYENYQRYQKLEALFQIVEAYYYEDVDEDAMLESAAAGLMAGYSMRSWNTPLSTVARSAAFSLPEFDFTGSVESMRNCP